jgi:hypothetical protein
LTRADGQLVADDWQANFSGLRSIADAWADTPNPKGA